MTNSPAPHTFSPDNPTVCIACGAETAAFSDNQTPCASPAKPKRLAFTTKIINVRANHEERDIELSLTNDVTGLSLVLRNVDEYSGTYTNLTPAEARELAAELVARADEIDANA